MAIKILSANCKWASHNESNCLGASTQVKSLMYVRTYVSAGPTNFSLRGAND